MGRIVRQNAYGLLETVDTKTGEVVSCQKPNKRMQAKIDSGVPMKVKRKLINEFDVYQYSKPLHDRIVELRLQGLSFSEISTAVSIPTAVIYGWKRKYPELAIDLQNSSSDRSSYYYDKVEELANQEYNKEEVPGARLKAQLFQWLAERGSPEEYSSRVKLSGNDGGAVTQLIVYTGIERNPHAEEKEEILQ